MEQLALWNRFRRYLFRDHDLGLTLDISRMNFPDGFFEKMTPTVQGALEQMNNLENGSIANPDENRMVGHYWLRAPERAPSPDLTEEINITVHRITEFANAVHSGRIRSSSGKLFTKFLLIGIGGSALGPQLVADALGHPSDPMEPFFFDNTDPDGFDSVLAKIGSLEETLCMVISKSGGTKETRNGMLEVREAFRKTGIEFVGNAVAITREGSELDRLARGEGWLARFPMWDWVGGRTSVTSAVGLLPAALQGIAIDGFLEGARQCDELTRRNDPLQNPATLLALMWYHATGGRGEKDMVILPYKDRLILFSRYLQQLVMESLGKEVDLDGKVVRQGIAVYGNKGSTDQHAYVQQLREGVDNFFVTFINVLRNRAGASIKVEEDATSGDFLHGFLLGTREALAENGRESVTLTLESLNARSLGVLIALYERAVGLYAFMVNVNAYHQPGVEAGKRGAEKVIELQRLVLRHLRNISSPQSVEEIADAVGAGAEIEPLFHILQNVSANPDHSVVATGERDIFQRRYFFTDRKH